MNWSKAKNILIIAFVITNLLLLYVVKSNESSLHQYPTSNEDFINDVKMRLSSKNIRVSTDIPKGTPSLPLLNIEYEIYNTPEKLIESFLGEYHIDDSKEDLYYNSNGDRVEIIDDKKILYERVNGKIIYSDLSRDQLIKITEDFMQQKGFSTEDYMLNDYRIMDGKYYIEYTKAYNNMSIDTAYMRFEIDKTGIRRFERQWIRSIVPNEGEILVTPASEALLRLLLMEEHFGKTIIDIELCYGSSLEKKSPNAWKRVIKSNVDPAWKIKFSDGTKELLEEY